MPTPNQSVQIRLNNLSPLDGRYANKLDGLRTFFSEYGLIRHRLRVEIEWLRALADEPSIIEVAPFSAHTLHEFDEVISSFSPRDAAAIKRIEDKTNHDVKALEYWIKRRFRANVEVGRVQEFIHFACTSEDINNLAHALMLQGTRQEILLPAIKILIDHLRTLAHTNADVAMMCRTHGQAATPSTLGKELANVVWRLQRACADIAAVRVNGKINGAVGNYNAHVVAYPELDWPSFARRFVEALGLEFNPYTVQIEPHDSIASLFDAFARLNNILIDLCRDLWGYISLGYLTQLSKTGETGSSTMPHKVNPIDFENAEGNLGMANSMLRHMADKLPVSRWQRDLSDSTVLRNMGVALGYCLLAYESCLRGLNKIKAAPESMLDDLDDNWELLAEPVQTVMRRYGVARPYEKLKALTRGQRVTKKQMQAFISRLPIPEHAKAALLQLEPSTYTGYAEKLADDI